jgi:hypothetical protein
MKGISELQNKVFFSINSLRLVGYVNSQRKTVHLGIKTDFEFLVLQKIPNIYKSNAFKSDKKKNWT